jgi:hypothetical protein
MPLQSFVEFTKALVCANAPVRKKIAIKQILTILFAPAHLLSASIQAQIQWVEIKRSQGFKYTKLRKAMVAMALSAGVAQSYAQASSWRPELTVTKAFTEASDLIVFYTSGTHTQTGGCSVNQWIYKIAPDARRNRAYAALLTAIVTGKKISLWQSGSGCAEWGFHEATAVMIVQ